MTQQDSTPEVSASSNRRSFLAKAGLTTLGVMGASKLALGDPLDFVASDLSDKALSANDANILNFALNLEYLEAEYFSRAAFGQGLSSADTGGARAGDVNGGTSAVSFSTPAIQQLAEELARDEQAHVRFLRSTLGSAAVPRPDLDFDQSFTNAARAAGLITGGQTFDAFADEESFLLAAFLFEDVGVTAYKGAAPLLRSKSLIGPAAGILAVEAYHAGAVRAYLISMGMQEPAQAISNLRDAVDGPGDKDQGIVHQGRLNHAPTDAAGMAFGRTTAEVLNIVYLGGAGGGFGFFPSRLNGAIR
jgi:hypothetical protein